MPPSASVTGNGPPVPHSAGIAADSVTLNFAGVEPASEPSAVLMTETVGFPQSTSVGPGTNVSPDGTADAPKPMSVEPEGVVASVNCAS